jgi:hypothetical protein
VIALKPLIRFDVEESLVYVLNHGVLSREELLRELGILLFELFETFVDIVKKSSLCIVSPWHLIITILVLNIDSP